MFRFLRNAVSLSPSLFPLSSFSPLSSSILPKPLLLPGLFPPSSSFSSLTAQNILSERWREKERRKGVLFCCRSMATRESPRDAMLKRKRAVALRQRKKKPVKILLPRFCTPVNLSSLLAVRAVDILKIMIKLGINPIDSNDPLTEDVVDLICEDLYFIPTREEYSNLLLQPSFAKYEEKKFKKEEIAKMDIRKRPPIVSVMGHVNHGKTSLLDALRGVETAKKEAGGITQFVSSFMIKRGKEKITFLDTPGHAAFSSMRHSSANVSDVIVLVIAADEGVQEQTVEAIHAIQKHNVPFVVAISKVDRETSHIDKISQQLVRHNVYTDQIGGQVTTVQISAPQKKGMDDLCDSILMEAEQAELGAAINGQAEAIVLDSKSTKKGLGVLAMTRWGTFKQGSHIVAGENFGRIRSFEVVEGGHTKTQREVLPSSPVVLYGLKEAPLPGEILIGMKSESEAKGIAKGRNNYRVQSEMVKEGLLAAERKRKLFLDSLENDSVFGFEDQEKEEEEGKKEAELFCVVLKAAAWGSAEALSSSLTQIFAPHQHELKLNIVRTSLGSPTDVDIEFAAESKGVVVCFDVKVPEQRKRACQDRDVKCIQGDVIFSVLEQVKEYGGSLLEPHRDKVIDGDAKIQQVFPIQKSGSTEYIAGSIVVSGSLKAKAYVDLIRDRETIGTGKIENLKHFKDSIRLAKKGTECGVSVSLQPLDEDDSEESDESEREEREEREEGEGEGEGEKKLELKKGDILRGFHWQETSRKIGETKRTG